MLAPNMFKMGDKWNGQGELSKCNLLFAWSEVPELGRTGLVCWYNGSLVFQTEYMHLAQLMCVCSIHTSGQMFQECRLCLLLQLGFWRYGNSLFVSGTIIWSGQSCQVEKDNIKVILGIILLYELFIVWIFSTVPALFMVETVMQ